MKSYLEFFNQERPILFINFDYDVKFANGKQTNLKDEINKICNNCVFIAKNKIHYYNGDVLIDNKPLTDFSLVFFGPVGDAYENYGLVSNYCKKKMIPLFSYGVPKYLNNKLLQTQVLEENNIQIPKTYTGKCENININFIEKEFGFPLVFKVAHGSQGRGVELANNKEELKSILLKYRDELALIQEFIPNNGDYRVYYIGDHFLFSVKRQSTDKSEFRSNISLGGKFNKVSLPWLPLNIANKAHRSMGFWMSGVDIIQDKKTKEWYVLEVNSAPQFNMTNKSTISTLKFIVDKINKIKK